LQKLCILRVRFIIWVVGKEGSFFGQQNNDREKGTNTMRSKSKKLSVAKMAWMAVATATFCMAAGAVESTLANLQLQQTAFPARRQRKMHQLPH